MRVANNSLVSDDADEICEWLERRYPLPTLAHWNSRASQLASELFSQFSALLREPPAPTAGERERSPAQQRQSAAAIALAAQLARIDAHLASQNSRFLCGDHMTQLDCLLLPKLQHVRVAARALRGFEVPHDLSAPQRLVPQSGDEQRIVYSKQ